MTSYGFCRLTICSPKLTLSNVPENVRQICKVVTRVVKENSQVICFPELALTGYTCDDLFHQSVLQEAVLVGLHELKKLSSEFPSLLLVVGTPFVQDGINYNCAAVFNDGHLRALVPKTYLPTYDEFNERLYFSPAPLTTNEVKLRELGEESVVFGTNVLFQANHDILLKIGVEVCEDLWSASPPSTTHSLNGATLLLNVSASNELVGKRDYRMRLARQQSERCLAVYAYVSSGVGESTNDLVFGGDGFVFENGTLIGELNRFQLINSVLTVDVDLEKVNNDRVRNTVWSDSCVSGRTDPKVVEVELIPLDLKKEVIKRSFNRHPFVPYTPDSHSLNERCQEIFSIQSYALAMRMNRSQSQELVIGVSGGLDSTHALLVSLEAVQILGFGTKTVRALTMPGFGTSDATRKNITKLCEEIGVTFETIPISSVVEEHLKIIGHEGEQDVTYENAQARERTQILFDKANQHRGIVVGTGDLSELALGWATYNGDHMSSYGVNASVPKTLVQFLIKWYADHKTSSEIVREVLYSILDTPISPELLPPSKEGAIQQITEERIGPYELHDFFLYYLVRHRFRPKKIHFLATKAFEGCYTSGEITHWLTLFLKRFFANQFKRTCLPNGPKVGSVSLSPRGEWRIPADLSPDVWLADLDNFVT